MSVGSTTLRGLDRVGYLWGPTGFRRSVSRPVRRCSGLQNSFIDYSERSSYATSGRPDAQILEPHFDGRRLGVDLKRDEPAAGDSRLRLSVIDRLDAVDFDADVI